MRKPPNPRLAGTSAGRMPAPAVVEQRRIEGDLAGGAARRLRTSAPVSRAGSRDARSAPGSATPPPPTASARRESESTASDPSRARDRRPAAAWPRARRTAGPRAPARVPSGARSRTAPAVSSLRPVRGAAPGRRRRAPPGWPATVSSAALSAGSVFATCARGRPRAVEASGCTCGAAWAKAGRLSRCAQIARKVGYGSRSHL